MQIPDRVEENFIEAHLQWDNRIDAKNITVHVDDGHVILQGFVPTYLDRKLTNDIVWQLPGVRSVVNHLTVKYPQDTELPTDEELKDNINHALTWHPAFDENDVEIVVTEGHVEIKGAVKTYWHKLSIEELMANIVGVIDISNQLAVVSTDDKADEATAKDIMEALHRAREVNVNDIDVKVKDGYVTLDGHVQSAEAYRQARNAAAFTFGVIDVENNLTIT